MNMRGGKLGRAAEAGGAVFFALGVLWIWISGYDVTVARASLALIFIGISLACSVVGYSGEGLRGNIYLSAAVLLGGGYFIARALIGGPIGLAVPDLLLIIYFLAVYFGVALGGEKFVKAGVLVLVPLCVAHVIFVAHQRFWPEDLHLIHGERGVGARPAGLYWHHNPFAAFSNSALFIFLFLGIGWVKKRVVKVVTYVLAAGLLWATWQSGSRGGWLALVAGSGVGVASYYLYLRSKKDDGAAVVALVGCLVIVIGLCSSWAVLKKKTEDASARAKVETEEVVIDGGRRLELMPIAFDFFIDEPVLGNGPRSFHHRVIEEWDPDVLPMWLPNPELAHNEFLQALCDYGLVGFLILLVVLLAILVHGLVQLVGQASGGGSAFLGATRLGAFAGLGAILTQCFFSFLLHIPTCLAMFAFFGGVLSLAVNHGRGAVKGVMLRLFGAGVGVASVAAGGVLFTSYFQLRNHQADIRSSMTGAGALRFVKKSHELGRPLFDPAKAALNGQIAMRFAGEFDDLKDPASAKALREEALKFFDASLVLDPKNQVSIAGIPQVLTALGRYEEAEEGHQVALRRLYTREKFLNVIYYAALNSYLQGYELLLEGKVKEAEGTLELAIDRIERRKEFPYKKEVPFQEAELRASLLGWSSYFEGRRLYQKALEEWKARDAGRALALSLEAEKRYQASRKVAAEAHPQWQLQWDHLQGTLGTLRAGQVQSISISEEEIEQIAAGLESFDSNR